jgi:hypothetical protein
MLAIRCMPTLISERPGPSNQAGLTSGLTNRKSLEFFPLQEYHNRGRSVNRSLTRPHSRSHSSKILLRTQLRGFAPAVHAASHGPTTEAARRCRLDAGHRNTEISGTQELKPSIQAAVIITPSGHSYPIGPGSGYWNRRAIRSSLPVAKDFGSAYLATERSC